MACPECKRESLEALHASGGERKTAIFVATAVWEVGLDIADIIRVVLFLLGLSISALVQRAGRPVRGLLTQGEAIVYVKQSDVQAALAYIACAEDLRILQPSEEDASANIPPTTQDGQGAEVSHIVEVAEIAADVPVPMDLDLDAAVTEANPVSAGEPQPAAVAVSSKTAKKALKRKGKTNVKASSSSKKTTTRGRKKTLVDADRGKAHTMYLVVGAHARSLCIQRQINIIYDNPAHDKDCQRCSSCKPRPIPQPRPIVLPTATPMSTAQPSEELQVELLPPHPEDDTNDIDNGSAELDNADEDQAASESTAKPAKRLKLLVKDVQHVLQQLDIAAIEIRHSLPWQASSLMMSSRYFLDQETKKLITVDFDLLRSRQALEDRLRGRWKHWETAGNMLWEHVETIHAQLCPDLEERHEEALAKKRAREKRAREEKTAKKVHTALEEAGLAHIRRVVLRVAPIPSTSRTLDKAPTSTRQHSSTPDPQITAPVAAHTLSLSPQHAPSRGPHTVTTKQFYGENVAASKKRRRAVASSEQDTDVTQPAAKKRRKQRGHTPPMPVIASSSKTLTPPPPLTRKENRTPGSRQPRRSTRVRNG
ncbi:hypothetical protein FA95DRAFT_1309818 [Auriscalpium vulgare]|uniref:Uncharacterized protein n=1 Tax=Auriscalpium vulgare TaxID=40419 RepID=A0ACB8R1V8_9AGAM|nr:hypothetical protein FA95DRAFT_1309818 [Auriscalpium vulgare]